MLCTKGKLYSVNIYSENWFAALPPWSTWPRMKAWYERLPAWTGKTALCSIYFQLLWGSFSGDVSASCPKCGLDRAPPPCPMKARARMGLRALRGSVTRCCCWCLSAQLQGGKWEERVVQWPLNPEGLKGMVLLMSWTLRPWTLKKSPFGDTGTRCPQLWHFLSLPDFLQAQLWVELFPQKDMFKFYPWYLWQGPYLEIGSLHVIQLRWGHLGGPWSNDWCL